MYASNDTPKNAKQVYIDGHRYRSLFAAAVDTNLTFCLLSKKVAAAAGAPTQIRKKNIVTEKWLLDNPSYFLRELQAPE